MIEIFLQTILSIVLVIIIMYIHCRSIPSVDSKMLFRYVCHCADGWEGTHCDEDVDECNSMETCPNGGICRNSHGGFHCDCPAGSHEVTCMSQTADAQVKALICREFKTNS
jgi:hypothetical protein